MDQPNPADPTHAGWLSERCHGSSAVFQSDSLAQHVDGADEYCSHAAGALAMGVGHGGYLLVLLRPEYVRTIDWAGKPEKHLMTNDVDGTQYWGPRRSFQLYRDTVWWRAKYPFGLRVFDLVHIICVRLSPNIESFFEAIFRLASEPADLDTLVSYGSVVLSSQFSIFYYWYVKVKSELSV